MYIHTCAYHLADVNTYSLRYKMHTKCSLFMN